MPSWFHTIQLALCYIPFPWENLVCYPKVSHSTKTILCSLEVLFSTTDAQGTSLTTPPSSIAPHHGTLLSTSFLPLSHHQKRVDRHRSRFRYVSFCIRTPIFASGCHLRATHSQATVAQKTVPMFGYFSVIGSYHNNHVT